MTRNLIGMEAARASSNASDPPVGADLQPPAPPAHPGLGSATAARPGPAGTRPPGGAPAISVRDLRKSYGDVRALDGVSLEVPRGTVLGLLGHNDAGKTTFVRVLTRLLKADSGAA